jgi:plasmid stability protein
VNRNLTINLPEELIDKLRIRAAVRKESMTALVKQAIEKVVADDGGEDEAKARRKRMAERMRNAPDLGLNGKIPWTRSELYER